jgi:hypothetical protein
LYSYNIIQFNILTQQCAGPPYLFIGVKKSIDQSRLLSASELIIFMLKTSNEYRLISMLSELFLPKHGPNDDRMKIGKIHL